MSDIVKHSLPVNGVADLELIGNKLSQSNTLGVSNPAAGFVVAMTCHMEGITPIEFGRKYHIIGGKPTMKPAAMAAEFRKMGGKIKKVERSATRAAAIFTFEGESEEYEFTIEDANRAELTGGKNPNWKKYPQNMLWARMISNALDVVCPEIRYGIYTPEEMEDVMIEEEQKRSVGQVVDPVEAAKVVQAEVVEEVAVDYNLIPFEMADGQGVVQPPNTFRWDQFTGDQLFAMKPTLDAQPNVLAGHWDVINSIIIPLETRN